jgi:ABC-type transporter Mla maintaining outer membrane lipid asymmetry ATPase subunit MlaF
MPGAFAGAAAPPGALAAARLRAPPALGRPPPPHRAPPAPPASAERDLFALGGAAAPPPAAANGNGGAEGAGSGDARAAAEPAPPAAEPAAAASSDSPASASAPPGEVLIEFRDVWKSFGSKAILRGASFVIRRGEAVGIIGSSGTGKSTALRLAAGLLEPDAGQVLIKGVPRRGLLDDDDAARAALTVGLVFQVSGGGVASCLSFSLAFFIAFFIFLIFSFSLSSSFQSGALFDSLTVAENVGFTLTEGGKVPPAAVARAVASALAKVGLPGAQALYPSELSGGMKKRVALARAIVTDASALSANAAAAAAAGRAPPPEQLIMYDEPTAGLDPVASTVVENLIRSMHEPPADCSAAGAAEAAAGAGVGGFASGSESDSGPGSREKPGGGISSYVVVTHQHSTIRRAVDRLIFLHEGRVVWEGSAEEFEAEASPEIVRQFANGSLEGPIRYD